MSTKKRRKVEVSAVEAQLPPDLPESCILCMPFSVQQPSSRAKSVVRKAKSKNSTEELVRCAKCNRFQCKKCMSNVCRLLEGVAEDCPDDEDKQSLLQNSWYEEARLLLHGSSSQVDGCVISRGTCCSFTASMPSPEDKQCNLVMPTDCLRYMKYSPAPAQDGDYVPAKEAVKMNRAHLKDDTNISNTSTLDFLHQYHDNECKRTTKHPFPTAQAVNAKRAKRRKGPRPAASVYEGGLHFAQFGGIIKSQADNNHLRTDILSLGRSNLDGTPDVWHSCINRADARKLEQLESPLRKIPREWRSDPTSLVAESPENQRKKRTWTGQIIMVPQVVDSAVAQQSRGAVDKDIKELANCWEFGVEDEDPGVEITFILGKSGSREARHPKLLLARIGSMIKHSITEKEAIQLYNSIRHLCGRSGFELRRKCGSSGITNAQSDRNLLEVMSHLHSAIPCKVCSCVSNEHNDRNHRSVIAHFHLAFHSLKGMGMLHCSLQASVLDIVQEGRHLWEQIM